MRNRVMLSGSWPVKFCPPSSLQEFTFPVRMDRTKKSRGERSHMRVMLPMQRRSPKATGTVPTSCGDALAEADEPALRGAVIAHPVDVQEAQLQVHGTPESVSKTTESEAPVATSSEAGDPRRKEWSRRKKIGDFATRTDDCWGGRRQRRRWQCCRHSCRRWRRRRRCRNEADQLPVRSGAARGMLVEVHEGGPSSHDVAPAWGGRKGAAASERAPEGCGCCLARAHVGDARRGGGALVGVGRR